MSKKKVFTSPVMSKSHFHENHLSRAFKKVKKQKERERLDRVEMDDTEDWKKFIQFQDEITKQECQ